MFVGPLPHKLAAFTAAASKVWREGILDTKCISEYGLAPAWTPSYLGLLYQRARLLNLQTASATQEADSAAPTNSPMARRGRYLRFRAAASTVAPQSSAAVAAAATTTTTSSSEKRPSKR